MNTKTYFFAISNGNFIGDINACDFSEATLVAYDIESQKESEGIDLEIMEVVDTGEIIVCF